MIKAKSWSELFHFDLWLFYKKPHGQRVKTCWESSPHPESVQLHSHPNGGRTCYHCFISPQHACMLIDLKNITILSDFHQIGVNKLKHKKAPKKDLLPALCTLNHLFEAVLHPHLFTRRLQYDYLEMQNIFSLPSSTAGQLSCDDSNIMPI